MVPRVREQKESALLVLWESGFSQAERVLQLVNEKLDVVFAERLLLPEAVDSVFFEEFYGSAKPDGYRQKIREIGGRQVLALVVVGAQNGSEDLQNCVDSIKQQLRVDGRNFLHSSDDIHEAKRNLDVLSDGRHDIRKLSNRTPFLAVPVFDEGGQLCIARESKAVPETLQETFAKLEKHVDYVVLRNWDSLVSGYADLGGGDVDILVDNPSVAEILLMGRRVFSDTKRRRFFVPVGNDVVAFDIRFVGDGYYDQRWQKRMLAASVNTQGFRTLDATNHYWSLVYHTLIHKGDLNKYGQKLSVMSAHSGPDILDLGDAAVRRKLRRYLAKEGLNYSEPTDPSVHFFREPAPSLRRLRYLFRLLTSELAAQIYREDLSFIPAFKHYPRSKRGRPLAGNVYRVGEYIVKRSSGPLADFLLENEFLRITAMSSHHGFPKAVGLYRSRGELFLVTRKIRGRDLSRTFARPRVQRALSKQARNLLQALETERIVHRDISEENLLWDGRQLHLIDFEFARDREREIPCRSIYEEKYLATLLPGVGRRWSTPGDPLSKRDEISITALLRQFTSSRPSMSRMTKRLLGTARSRGKFLLSRALRERLRQEILFAKQKLVAGFR